MWDELFRFAVQHSLEMILVFQRDGKIIYGNHAAKEKFAFGEELLNCKMADIFPELFQEEQVRRKDLHIGEKQKTTAYRENKTCFTVLIKILCYSEEKEWYICSGFDISEQNLLEKKIVQAGQEAEAALKVKSEFVANVTHELRTPVNGILGNTKELINIETEESKIRLLNLVERGCRDMNAIINNILDFSKLEAGKFSLEIREFHFRNMMDYIKSNHINKITEKGLEFFMTISPEIPEYVIGDELRIGQILNNLLSNACKFTSVGKITVQVVKTAQFHNRMELFFIIIDSGIGIDKVEQDKLFQSFSQVDASISRKFGGTGLGLNICKQLVELMDGTIRVESERNKGSMFSFNIWVEVPEGATEETEEHLDPDSIVQKLMNFTEDSNENIWKYGEPENLEEIQKKMSKLILCVEMDNWEKAEMFADTLKQLTEEAPREIKTAMLRLKMAVQKENYEKAVEAFEKLEEVMK